MTAPQTVSKTDAGGGDKHTALLAGQVAFVTGAASGIGAAVAARMAEEGAAVVLADLDLAQANQQTAGLTARGLIASSCRIDVTDPSSVAEALNRCLQLHGRVDVLVANAGVLHNGSVLETSDEAWTRVLGVNLTGVFLCLKVFGKQMVGQGQGGRLIATSSIAGKRGGRFYGAYTAAKFGVIGLVECLASELADRGITVNAVCPGTVDTPMMAQLYREHASLRGGTRESISLEMLDSIPMRRMGDPKEIADVYVFLASPLARYITGESIVVDGGQLIGP